MIRQFKAMLIDAYRELNSKRLFWVILFITGIIVLYYGSIGFNERGMSMFFGLWQIDSEMVREGSPLTRILYVSIFSSFFVGIWMAWIAVIMALVATTSVFPDFMAGGSIDIVLSKPISRTSLFFSKYFSSLLFMLLQVSVLCVGVWLCLGLRLGEWNWLIFAVIPLVTLMYSYLYAVNVLIGVWTRSALTALLLTMLFWVSIFSINMTDGILTQIYYQQSFQLKDLRANAAAMQKQTEQSEEDFSEMSSAPPQSAATPLQQQIESTESTVQRLDRWRNRVRVVQVVLPKTGETVDLLDRWLSDPSEVNIFDIFSGNARVDESGEASAQGNRERRVQQEIIEEYRQRSLWYVIGTSLIFESVVLFFAWWIFVRRDY